MPEKRIEEVPYERTVKYIAKELGSPQEKLTPETTLFSLGLDGEDAEEFIQGFAENFSVDFSEFDFSRHFGEEGLRPDFLFHWIVAFMKWLRFKSWEEAVGKEPICISDLVRAVHTGKWRKVKKLSRER